jgi:hypothetical protein
MEMVGFGQTPLFLSDAMSLFRVTKSTGPLLAIVKASDPSLALDSYAGMRSHLNEICFGIWFGFPLTRKGILSSGGSHPSPGSILNYRIPTAWRTPAVDGGTGV